MFETKVAYVKPRPQLLTLILKPDSRMITMSDGVHKPDQEFTTFES